MDVLSPERLQEVVCNLPGRSFGNLAEIMLKRLLLADNSSKNNYDLELSGNRIEAKFSVARKKQDLKMTEKNMMAVLQKAMLENSNDRFMPLLDAVDCKYPFEIKFSGIKRKEFDVLYYGLFFKDTIAVFKILESEISSIPSLSEKQHRGAKNMCQFPLTDKTFNWHIDNTMETTLSYDTLFLLINDKDKNEG